MGAGRSDASSSTMETGNAIGPREQTMCDAALVALLRATLGTADAPGSRPLETCDWTPLEMLAAHHAVAPIVYRALEARADAVPRVVLRRMWLAYRANALPHPAGGEASGRVRPRAR